MISPWLVTWLWYHAGLSSPNSPWYLFWSGIGADWTRLLAAFSLIHLAGRIHKHGKRVAAHSENPPS